MSTKIPNDVEALSQFIELNQPLVAITGAGVSAASGIPTYRDDSGAWQHSNPIQHQDFVTRASARRRYWARSLAGWPEVAGSEPNQTHRSLKTLEDLTLCKLLITQNVDRLHQRSGHRQVIDLHGRLDRVHCLDCQSEIERHEMQEKLWQENPGLNITINHLAPDGDADVADHIIKNFHVPVCDNCGGMLKPSVVFYGGSVPKHTVNRISDAITNTAGVLVVGSSLMVFSSFRFCRAASRAGKPLAILNLGHTRADDLSSLKIEAPAETILPEVVSLLKANRPKVSINI